MGHKKGHRKRERESGMCYFFKVKCVVENRPRIDRCIRTNCEHAKAELGLIEAEDRFFDEMASRLRGEE
jgi:hypothetical protein